MDFTTISRAGLTQREFADLAGVSRVTTNMWVTGKMSPHRFIKDNVDALLKALDSALSYDQFPLPKSIPKHQRVERAREIVAAYLPEEV
jgi:transcriptional regulator with XRE-family HTH domain